MRITLIISTLAGVALAHPGSCRTRQVIKDGGFESGTTPSTSSANPWLVHDIVYSGTASYGLTSPGSPNNGGEYAFTTTLIPRPHADGRNGLTLSQTMKTCAGQNYSIIADYKFEYADGNNCALTVEYPYKDTRGRVITPSAVTSPGQWSFTGSTFQAVSSADVFDVVFSCSNSASNKFTLDNVKIERFDGNAF